MATMLVEHEAPSALADTVRLAQQGDVAAFERLYRENVDRVFALCLRMSGDGGGAQELAQDVFVRAWEKLGTFEGKSAFSTWLHRLAVNVCLGSRRSEGIRIAKVFGTDDLEAYEGPGRAAEPGDAIDLERAIATLPAGARTVFVMHDVEGYKHEEIAELHGLAVGTCKAQLHRARRLLREALGR
jgi:RNA polymerase sigma-70 factor (ECF subfamily)